MGLFSHRLDDHLVHFDRNPVPKLPLYAWRVGKLVNRTKHDYAIESPQHMLEVTRAHLEQQHHVKTYHYWGHGRRGEVSVGDEEMLVAEMGELLRPQGVELVWYRCCDVARSWSYMVRSVRAFGCPVAAHVKVISAPNLLKQEGLVVVTPRDVEENNRWYLQPGAVIRACRSTDMVLPAWAMRA